MTLDDLERPSADTNSCRKYAFYGALQKKMNEDRLTSRDKCRPMILVYMVYRAPREGALNDCGVVDDGNFQRFRKLEAGYTTLCIAYTGQPLIGFRPLIPKCMTLNDFESILRSMLVN